MNVSILHSLLNIELMKTKINHFWLASITAIFLVGIFASCSDNVLDKELPYLFRPVAFTATVNKTKATLNWAKVDNAVSYTLQISQDSLTFKNIISTITTTDHAYTIELAGGLRYSARVRANASDTTQNSKYNETLTFPIAAEQILSVSNVKFTSAALSWTGGLNVTKIVYCDVAKPTNLITVTLTPAQIASGNYQLTSLVSGSSYDVKIYNNSYVRGEVTITTPSVPGVGTARIIYLNATDSINNVLDTCTATSITLVIPANTTFGEILDLPIKNGTSVTFYGDPTGTALPKVSFKKIQLPAVAGTITFQNIDISGSNSDANQNYMINQSTATTTDAVIFDNCTIHHFRSVARLQSTTSITINNLTINNCITYDNGYGGYALVYSNVATGLFKNITISKSTVWGLTNAGTGVDVGLIICSGAQPLSINVDQCTFYNMVIAAKYLIDIGAAGTAPISLTNCIIGKSNCQLTTAGAKGIRYAGTLSISGCYNTSDWITTSNSFYDKMTPYANTSAVLFKSPDTGVFTINDASFVGKTTAGDPRWR